MEKIKNLITGDKKDELAQATNPFTGETSDGHKFITDEELEQKLKESWEKFQIYRRSDPKGRAQKFKKLAEVLKKDSEKFAKTITQEMGKPIQEARREVTSAIKECEFFSENLEKFLETETIQSKDAKKSYVLIQPLGPLYHVTPFNFPFWLLFRGTVAAMAMGNTVVNKNPATCPQCGINAEQAFKDAGFTNGEFMNLIINQKQSELIIKNKHIRGVSFTGSTDGGAKVAAWAGQYSKKSVMELGGNDAFVVCDDADLDKAVKQGIEGRLLNGGQCCTAAKRFIIDEKVYDQFRDKLVEEVKKVKVGDPMDEDTKVGPLAKRSGLEKIMEQVERAKAKGGRILYGGKQPKDESLKRGSFFMPTVVEIEESNPLFWEESFGPVFALLKSKNEQDAIRMANHSQYGLGGAVFSKNEEKAQKIAAEIETGFVFINHMLTWSAEAPEGGVKESGYGREGGKQGAHEFVNIKTIWIP